jgi:hypothetical protein
MRSQVIRRVITLRGIAPQTVALNLGLGRLYGRGINSHNGAIRYGEPQIGSRNNFTGYAAPPQLFTGYSAKRVATGAIKPTQPALPSTTSPDTLLQSPLSRAMATVGARQMAGGY